MSYNYFCKRSNDYRGYEGLVNIAQHQKDSKAIIQYAKSFQDKFPDMWKSYWWLGQAYKNLAQYPEAKAQFNVLISKFPNDYRGYEGLVNIAQHQKDSKAIIQYAKSFQDKFPDMWKSYWWLGQAYKNLAQYPEAKAQFNVLISKFPNDYRGYEGLVNIAQHQKDSKAIIQYAKSFQDKFPDMWKSYWWLGQAYKNLAQYPEAKAQFNVLISKFPNDYRGYEGLVNIAQHQKDSKAIIQYAKSFQDKFPDMWKSYWWLGQAYKNLAQYPEAKAQFIKIKDKFPNMKEGWIGLFQTYTKEGDIQSGLKYYSKITNLPTSNEKDLFDYFKVLLRYRLTKEASEVISRIFHLDSKSPYGYFAFSLFHNSKKYAKISIENCKKSDPLYKEIILSTQYLLEKDQDYRFLINDLLVRYPHDNQVIEKSIRQSYSGHPLSFSLPKIAERYKEVLNHNNNPILVSKLIEILLSCNEIAAAETLIKESLEKFPEREDFNRYYCLLLAYTENYQEFDIRYHNYLSNYGHNSTLFFHYFNMLVFLDRTQEIYKEYYDFNNFRYGEKLNPFELNNFQINSLFSHKKIDIKPLCNICLEIDLPKANFNEIFEKNDYIQYEKIINNKMNKVLIICFEGLSDLPQKQYNFNRMKDLKLYKSLSKKKNFGFRGFAKKTTQFNFLLVKDISSSFFQHNTDYHIEKIKGLANEIGYDYLVTLGASAGGFASILIGEKLSANVNFAFHPRVQAFMFTDNPYFREIQIRYQFFSNETLDLSCIQRLSNGFNSKNYITICKNEPRDFLTTRFLNKADPNLNITYLNSDIHNTIKYMGTKNTFIKVIKNIENELANNFSLPINKDIFDQATEFK